MRTSKSSRRRERVKESWKITNFIKLFRKKIFFLYFHCFFCVGRGGKLPKVWKTWKTGYRKTSAMDWSKIMVGFFRCDELFRSRQYSDNHILFSQVLLLLLIYTDSIFFSVPWLSYPTHKIRCSTKWNDCKYFIYIFLILLVFRFSIVMELLCIFNSYSKYLWKW